MGRLSRSRPLRAEVLEDRHLLASGSGIDTQWQNSLDRFDVNADSRVSPHDALVLANAMLANGRRQINLPETGFATGVYPDVTGNAIASRADFDMVMWELDRRLRESEGGGFSSLLDEENYPPLATHGIANFLRWGESNESDTVFGFELFDDPDHEDTELTFTYSVGGDTNIFDAITFNPSTGGVHHFL